jgi:DinB family protein
MEKFMDAKTLSYAHRFSGRVIERNLDGITQKLSLIHPKPEGNCLNWIFGHLVRGRVLAMKLLGASTPLSMEQFALYEETPVTPLNESQAMSWDTLVKHFRSTQTAIEDALQKVSPSQLDAQSPFSPSGNPDETVGSLLTLLAYHEGYHCGQIAMGRRIAGLPGVIKAPKLQTASR